MMLRYAACGNPPRARRSPGRRRVWYFLACSGLLPFLSVARSLSTRTGNQPTVWRMDELQDFVVGQAIENVGCFALGYVSWLWRQAVDEHVASAVGVVRHEIGGICSEGDNATAAR